MKRRDFLKSAISAVAATAITGLRGDSAVSSSRLGDKLKIRYFVSKDGKMVPAPVESLKRIYFMDVDYNPIPVKANLTGQDGVLITEMPRVAFKITCADWIDGFGWMYVVADNGGRGYQSGELQGEVNLCVEVARSRLASVESASDDAKKAGVVLRPDIQERIEKARGLIQSAKSSDEPDILSRKYWDALSELMWAGEMISVDRARYRISRMSPRKEFKFGANAFHCLDAGEKYTRAFYELLNYCTLPFYYRSFESVRGKPAWDRLNRMVEWCQKGSIVPKGHPLVWFHPAGVPDWLEDRSFENVFKLHERRIADIVRYYKGRIDYWDVINEAHDFANTLNFSYEQLLKFTEMACRAARAANRKATIVVNSTALWGEYAAAKPGEPLPQRLKRTPLQYVADCVSGGFDFDVIGLQIYYPQRDMFEVDRMLERFGRFGKPVHITEHAMASDTSEDPASNVKVPWGHWHAPHSQTTQADWIEQLWTIAYSKPFITAITYWDFCDKGGHFWPHGGFLDRDLEPKEVYHRIKNLLESWGVGRSRSS